MINLANLNTIVLPNLMINNMNAVSIVPKIGISISVIRIPPAQAPIRSEA